MLGRQEMHT